MHGHTGGPFTNPPFANLQVSPIGIVPKKHSDKFRTIFHLSFPKTAESINSFIERDDFSLQYIKIDDAIAALIRLGRGTYLAKTDIESAFRQFPVHPEDWELLGMYWNNSYYFDKVIKCYHLVYVARRIFLINFLMRLNGFFLTSVL